MNDAFLKTVEELSKKHCRVIKLKNPCSRRRRIMGERNRGRHYAIHRISYKFWEADKQVREI